MPLLLQATEVSAQVLHGARLQPNALQVYKNAVPACSVTIVSVPAGMAKIVSDGAYSTGQ